MPLSKSLIQALIRFPVDVLHKGDGSRFGGGLFLLGVDRALSVTLPDQPLGPDGYASAAQHQTAGPVMGRLQGDCRVTGSLCQDQRYRILGAGTYRADPCKNRSYRDCKARGLTGLEMTDFEANRNVVKHIFDRAFAQVPAAQTAKTRKPLWKRWLS